MKLKKVHVNGIRIVGVFGLLVIITVFLTVPNVTSTDPFESVEIIPQNPEDIVNEAKIITTSSIVDTDIKFTESDDSIITQFLDTVDVDSPLSSEKFGIETQIALFDSSKKQVPTTNDIFGLPQLSVSDERGNLLDLGLIQTSFKAITRDKESSINVSGTVLFYLDDIIVKTKKIWISSTAKSLNTDLFIVDNIPPSFSERDTNFTFTLSDEGRDWIDGSTHVYRVVIKDVLAELLSESSKKNFMWSGEHIAYELKVKVNGLKKVILDSNSLPIEVTKSDDKLTTCGMTNKADAYDIKTLPLPVTVKQGDNVLINNGIPILPKSIPKGQLTHCTELLTNIPRDADIVFIIGGKESKIHTPKTQQNYLIEAKRFQDGYGGNAVHGHTLTNIDGLRYIVSHTCVPYKHWTAGIWSDCQNGWFSTTDGDYYKK